jgi:hypothetical protein
MSGSEQAARLRVKLTRYRNQAEELRAIAEDVKQTDTRESVMKLAAEYDDMAETVKQMLSDIGER